MKMSIHPGALALSFLLLASGPALAAPAKADLAGIEAAFRLKPEDAAPKLYAFLKAAPPTHEQFAWAQLHLARSLFELGHTHAAAVYLAQIARERSNPEVLPRALERLRQLARAPHDEVLIDEQVFGTMDVAFLPESLAAYANLQQGLTALYLGKTRWAEVHLSALPKGSEEYYEAEYVQLLRRLRQTRKVSDEMIGEFEALANAADAPQHLRIEAQLAVARLLYERGDLPATLRAYERVALPELDPGRAALYVEEAWTRYRQGDLVGAMADLNTIEAPTFRNEFIPDRYILRALIFRRLCHYLPARRALREFNRRYANSVQAIKQRTELSEDEELQRAALLRGAARRASAFHDLLERESDLLTRHSSNFGPELHEHLARTYAVARAEAKRVLELRQQESIENEANRLLEAAEQIELIDYEVGLRIYDRIRENPDAPMLPEDEALSPGQISFLFEGEYWNDELRNFEFVANSRCKEGELE